MSHEFAHESPLCSWHTVGRNAECTHNSRREPTSCGFLAAGSLCSDVQRKRHSSLPGITKASFEPSIKAAKIYLYYTQRRLFGATIPLKQEACSSLPIVVVEGLPHTHENHPSHRSRVSNALEEALGHQDLLHNLIHENAAGGAGKCQVNTTTRPNSENIATCDPDYSWTRLFRLKCTRSLCAQSERKANNTRRGGQAREQQRFRYLLGPILQRDAAQTCAACRFAMRPSLPV